MDKILENSLLFDFYGELLTEKQKEIYKMHNEDDLSLSEIGDELKITRQSVHDSLKHTKKALEDYESKLGLVSKFMLHKEELEKTLELIAKIETNDKKIINLVKEKINKVIGD